MSKIVSLEESVRKVIKPNLSLHFSFTHNRAMVYSWEIIRQFREKKLNLHLVGTGMLEYAIALIWAGHVKKLEGAFFGETYPAPRPNKLIMQLAREGKLEIEYWTNLTVPQRFMAAAYGWDYIPTNSLINSSLLDEHLKSGKAFINKDPKNNKETVMIRSFKPDVAIVHGSVADEEGNTVITPPYGEDLWGVFAAKKVVVIVEKIVDKNTIRSLSHLVKIPSYKVDFLVEVPFGAHPYGTSPIGLSEYAYSEDYEFRLDFSKAIQNNIQLDEWMKKWGLDKSHEVFLASLGKERLNYLKNNLGKSDAKVVNTKDDEGVTITERLIISASRILAEEIKNKNIKMVLAGIGISHLTAWLVYKRLKSEGFSIQLLTETGYYGYEPIDGDPYIFNFGNLYTNSKQSSFVEILGQFVGDSDHSCLAILSAAQIDKQGNLNSTKIPEKNLFLTGSGGANDIASVASHVVVMMSGDRRKFVKQVPYITSPGNKVNAIFTNVAVLTRKNNNGPFIVNYWISDEKNNSANELKQALKNLIPWDIKIDESAHIMNEPTAQELKWLRDLDPQKVFLKE